MSGRPIHIRRLMIAVLTVFASLFPLVSLGDTNLDPAFPAEGILTDDTWQYVGYITGGVTFAVPKESCQADLTEKDKSSGILMLLWNDDYTLQLKVFEPEVMTYDRFRERVCSEPSARVSVRTSEGVEILSYRNTIPASYSELFGIVMTGLDGRMYKISVFTGDSESFGDDASVWKIAEIIEKTTRIQDFSEWGIDNE